MKTPNAKLLLGIILLVGFFVYASSLPNAFVWDDEEQIVNNATLRDWENLPLIFTSSTFYAGGAGLQGGFYRPLVSLFYLANYKIWGLNSFGFHFFQLLLHLANVTLIFLILRKILENFGNLSYSQSAWISFVATLLFAVHPANVESVAYSGSIGEILYSFFILLALRLFLKSFPITSAGMLPTTSTTATPLVFSNSRELANIEHSPKYFSSYFFTIILGFIFAFLGLLSKETAVVIFPIIAAYLFLFAKPKLKMWLSSAAGSGAVLGLYLFLRFFVAKIPTTSAHFAPISAASFVERLLTIPYSIFSYFKIIFFPKALTISHQFVVTNASDIKFWGSLIFILAISASIGFYIWKTKSKISLFFILWFFASLLPALNIIPLEMTIAERWLYFPLIGFFGFISIFIFQLIAKLSLNWRRISFALLGCLIILFGIRNAARAADWKNGLTLFSNDIKYSKNNFDLENNLGVELFRAGEIEEAGTHFEKSIKLQPNWTYSRNNLGAVLEKKGELEKALAEYKKSAELSDYYLVYENIGGILLKMEKYSEAEKFLLEAIQKFPKDANLKWQLAVVYLAENDTQKAVSLLSVALQDNPQDAKIRQLLTAIQKGAQPVIN